MSKEFSPTADTGAGAGAGVGAADSNDVTIDPVPVSGGSLIDVISNTLKTIFDSNLNQNPAYLELNQLIDDKKKRQLNK